MITKSRRDRAAEVWSLRRDTAIGYFSDPVTPNYLTCDPRPYTPAEMSSAGLPLGPEPFLFEMQRTAEGWRVVCDGIVVEQIEDPASIEAWNSLLLKHSRAKRDGSISFLYAYQPSSVTE